MTETMLWVVLAVCAVVSAAAIDMGWGPPTGWVSPATWLLGVVSGVAAVMSFDAAKQGDRDASQSD